MFTRVHVTVVLAVVLSSRLSAQQVQVQQPRVQVFGVDTAVSVPDRGGIFLGGVSQGATGRQVYGPIPWGSSWGQSFSNSSSWSFVWIHDLQAMDQAVLAEAEARRGERNSSESLKPVLRYPPAIVEQAERAARQLLQNSTPPSSRQ